MRLWAEPETGGEAYIPLAPSKRPRSTAILEEVERKFGRSGSGGQGNGATSDDIAALGELLVGLRADLKALPRTYQTMQRQNMR